MGILTMTSQTQARRSEMKEASLKGIEAGHNRHRGATDLDQTKGLRRNKDLATQHPVNHCDRQKASSLI